VRVTQNLALRSHEDGSEPRDCGRRLVETDEVTRERLLALLTVGLDAKPTFMSGGVLICNMPFVHPLAYLHKIYPVLSSEDLMRLQANVGRVAPMGYRDFLYNVGNGARLFNLNLNGFLAQLRRDASDPLGQPIDLRYGNVHEHPPGLVSGAFAIGAMVGWSSRGTLVMEPSGEVLLVDPADGSDIAARWADLDEMLTTEIARLTALHDRTGRQLSSATELMHPGGRKWETSKEPLLH
jgi:hypothetical protein